MGPHHIGDVKMVGGGTKKKGKPRSKRNELPTSTEWEAGNIMNMKWRENPARPRQQKTLERKNTKMVGPKRPIVRRWAQVKSGCKKKTKTLPTAS